VFVNHESHSLKAIEGSRILVTGASGWLGHELLCALQNTFVSFKGVHLTLAGSSSKSIDIHGRHLAVVPLKDVNRRNSFDLIIHLAFATQEKVAVYGKKEFVSLNSELNSKIREISNSNPLAKKLILSSGAVSHYLGNVNDGAPMEIYAKLKHDLESLFQEDGSLILRLWNTTGHHLALDTNSKYAISEFITCAERNSPIVVGKNLRRTYVDAASVFEASISYLTCGGNGIVNSGGELISLKELALLVAKTLESSSKVSLLEDGEFPSLDYVSPISEIPSQFWRVRIGLSDQIRNTASLR
jgi:nucleoside-diphosphate-sugar epimerase